MDKETKQLVIKICAICGVSGLAIALLGDAGLIITFLCIILFARN